MSNQTPLRIAFAGSSGSGKTTIANTLYKILEKNNEVMKVSIADPIKWIAKKRYGSSVRKDWIVIGMEVRNVKPDHWIDMLKKKIQEFPPTINIIVDDVRFHNEVLTLTTLGFQIVHMDIPWNVRFNRLVKKIGENNPQKFTDSLRWFGHESELALLPNHIYDHVIRNEEDKYKFFWKTVDMEKDEVKKYEKSCNVFYVDRHFVQ